MRHGGDWEYANTENMVTTESPWASRSHHVSRINFDDEVLAGVSFPRPLRIFDSTIRKILLTPGVRVSLDDLLFVAEQLQRVGTSEVMLNVDWWGDQVPDEFEYEVARAFLARQFPFRINVYSDALLPNATYGTSDYPLSAEEAVARLADIGALSITAHVGDPGPALRGWQEERLREVAEYSRVGSLELAFCLVDPARKDADFLRRTIELGRELGVRRFDAHDSNGSLSPSAAPVFLRRLAGWVGDDGTLVFHVHNDFGLATATAVLGATGGANPDASLAGISYRAGFAATEEVALALELLYGAKTGLDLSQLSAAATAVCERIGFPIHPTKAIIGRNAMTLNLPTWIVQQFGRNREAAPPATTYDPGLVGRSLDLVWGDRKSRFALARKIEDLGMTADDAAIEAVATELQRKLDDKSRQPPNWISDEELEQVCREVVLSRKVGP
jgi:D-citramalate synthase